MFYLKKLLATLILPPTGPLLLAFWGLWLARRHPRSGRALALFGLSVLFALSLPPVADGLTHSLETHPPITAQDLARVQAIVILGGGNYPAAPEYGGDTIGRWSLERARYGVHLQRRSGLPILVSGGAPYGGRPEAETMKDAIEHDLQGKVKWAEGASRDTAENASESARMLKSAGIRRIALVSHAWHLPRAIMLFEQQGLEVIAAPTGFDTHAPDMFAQFLPSAGALLGSSMALNEWLGQLFYRLKAAI